MCLYLQQSKIKYKKYKNKKQIRTLYKQKNTTNYYYILYSFALSILFNLNALTSYLFPGFADVFGLTGTNLSF